MNPRSHQHPQGKPCRRGGGAEDGGYRRVPSHRARPGLRERRGGLAAILRQIVKGDTVVIRNEGPRGGPVGARCSRQRRRSPGRGSSAKCRAGYGWAVLRRQPGKLVGHVGPKGTGRRIIASREGRGHGHRGRVQEDYYRGHPARGAGPVGQRPGKPREISYKTGALAKQLLARFIGEHGSGHRSRAVPINKGAAFGISSHAAPVCKSQCM